MSIKKQTICMECREKKQKQEAREKLINSYIKTNPSSRMLNTHSTMDKINNILDRIQILNKSI